MDVSEASRRCHDVIDTLAESIIADRVLFEDLLVGLLARGHALIEDQ